MGGIEDTDRDLEALLDAVGQAHEAPQEVIVDEDPSKGIVAPPDEVVARLARIRRELEGVFLETLAPNVQAYILKTEQEARIDPLTELPNRKAYNELEIQINGSRGMQLTKDADVRRDLDLKHPLDCSVLVIDIDGLKTINDTYGHDQGDIAIRSMSTAIKQSLRESFYDSGFRTGGDEFAVVLMGTKEEGARVVAERIRANMENLGFSCSIGISYSPADENVHDAAVRADALALAAKETGKNRVIAESDVMKRIISDVDKLIRSLIRG